MRLLHFFPTRLGFCGENDVSGFQSLAVVGALGQPPAQALRIERDANAQFGPVLSFCARGAVRAANYF